MKILTLAKLINIIVLYLLLCKLIYYLRILTKLLKEIKS